jgi:two-component system NtrC family sensor kinase
MLTAQRHSIRMLQGVLIGAAALPILLFCFAAWQSEKDGQRVAESQIERSRDVLNEHALKVFEAVERGIAEINEIIRDMSDEEILANQQKLHDRLERMVSSSAEMKSFWIFDRNGRALVSNLEFPTPFRTATTSARTSNTISAPTLARSCAPALLMGAHRFSA